jgi:hypothetical protein
MLGYEFVIDDDSQDICKDLDGGWSANVAPWN